jgi:hypothetical protein
VRLVAQRGARVLLEVPQPLKSLLSKLDGVAQICTRGEPPIRFDFQCPLLSLPLAFSTRADTIPGATPYLYADSVNAMQWRNRLGESNKRRVGLVWSGNPGHRNDHHRSIPLSLFAPVLAFDALFTSLQKELREPDRVALEQWKHIFHFGNLLEDFSDTAALVECMDLIITVDTAVAHLAGAMGKPVWILLPYNPDWRWMLERDDTPWYPSARLFRQRAAGDWHGVIAAVTLALQETLR